MRFQEKKPPLPRGLLGTTDNFFNELKYQRNNPRGRCCPLANSLRGAAGGICNATVNVKGGARPRGNNQQAYLSHTSPRRACFPSLQPLGSTGWALAPNQLGGAENLPRDVGRGVKGAAEGMRPCISWPKHEDLPAWKNFISVILRNLPPF